MKREIKFRGFDGAGWIYGSAVQYDKETDTWYMIKDGDVSDEWMVVGWVGQFTGLYDVNEKEIYEDDKVMKSNSFSSNVGRVVFQGGAFNLQFNYSWGMSIRPFSHEDVIEDMGASTTLENTYEVVGTIYDSELERL